MSLERYLEEHIEVFNASRIDLPKIEKIGNLISDRIKNGNKILIAGNGGSAADAQHFSAELTGRFEIEREGLSAIALTTDTSAITAIANDYGYEKIFSRQLEALGKQEDIFFAISTSGSSSSILNALMTAKLKGLTSILLSGKKCDENISDYTINAPSEVTAYIQEFHIFVLHCLCRVIDKDYNK